MYTFIDPTVPLLPKRSYNPNVAYMISMFEADEHTTHQLDRKWGLWSGADFIATRIPPQLQLQRLTLHKRSSHTGNFMYILMCELSEALAHLPVALEFVETIRARQCGYTALYSIDHFFWVYLFKLEVKLRWCSSGIPDTSYCIIGFGMRHSVTTLKNTTSKSAEWSAGVPSKHP